MRSKVLLLTILAVATGCNCQPSVRRKIEVMHTTEKSQSVDTTKIWGEQSEVHFIEYIRHLHTMPIVEQVQIVDALFDHYKVSHYATNQLVELSEKYLYDPNSPLRNEELYILFLNRTLTSEKVDKYQKMRFAHQLETAMKNRVGDIAADFEFTLKEGEKSSLHLVQGEFILLMFNNPECGECARQKEIIELNPTIFERDGLTILSIYPDEDEEAWRRNEVPQQWLNGMNNTLSNSNLYDLKAIPTLYLLDSSKRILLKDATLEQIAHALQKRR